MSEQPLLQLRGVSKRFGAVQALFNVDFEVKNGEVMALVGDNGAGKSTMIKGIAGIYSFDSGETLFDGQPVHIRTPHDSATLGIEVVYQDLALADNLDVVANMFLGRERTTTLDLFRAFSPLPFSIFNEGSKWRERFKIRFSLDEDAMEKASIETLVSLSVSTLRSVRLPVASLSGGQRQAIAVAKAVMWNSKLVILDEPTAALGVAQTRQVLDLVRRLADKGLAVVLISHNMYDVFEVADRITVLRLGQKVGLYNRKEVDQREIVFAITAGALQTVPGMNEK